MKPASVASCTAPSLPGLVNSRWTTSTFELSESDCACTAAVATNPAETRSGTNKSRLTRIPFMLILLRRHLVGTALRTPQRNVPESKTNLFPHDAGRPSPQYRSACSRKETCKRKPSRYPVGPTILNKYERRLAPSVLPPHNNVKRSYSAHKERRGRSLALFVCATYAARRAAALLTASM